MPRETNVPTNTRVFRVTFLLALEDESRREIVRVAANRMALEPFAATLVDCRPISCPDNKYHVAVDVEVDETMADWSSMLWAEFDAFPDVVDVYPYRDIEARSVRSF